MRKPNKTTEVHYKANVHEDQKCKLKKSALHETKVHNKPEKHRHCMGNKTLTKKTLNWNNELKII